MTPFLLKTIRFLGKSPNPAAVELLLPLLGAPETDLRGAAWEALYLRKDPELMLVLFDRFTDRPDDWKGCKQVTDDRLGKIVQTAILSGNAERMAKAKNVVAENKIYEAMPSFVALLEKSDKAAADYGAEGVFLLGEMFYEDLAAAPSGMARANLDRRRSWLAGELDGVVKRFGVHGKVEPLKSLLMVAKKDYETFETVVKDVHSAACKKIMEILATETHPGFYRLLLGFVDDSDSPPSIDVVIAGKSEPVFIRNLLRVVGDNPGEDAKKALRRFNGFSWLDPSNPDLPDLIAGQETQFVRLITNISIPRERLLALFRFIMTRGAVEGRRTAAEAMRQYPGDDFNTLVLERIDDPDPTVCSRLLRIVKGREFKNADTILAKFVDRQDPEINKTLYELMPDFRVDNFITRMNQYSENQAYAFGWVVRNVDPNTHKILGNEIGSFISQRRLLACDAIRFTGTGADFVGPLCHIAENDEEPGARVAALNALADVLNKEAIVALQNAMQDKSFVIREAANAAAQKWMKRYKEATANRQS